MLYGVPTVCYVSYTSNNILFYTMLQPLYELGNSSLPFSSLLLVLFLSNILILYTPKSFRNSAPLSRPQLSNVIFEMQLCILWKTSGPWTISLRCPGLPSSFSRCCCCFTLGTHLVPVRGHVSCPWPAYNIWKTSSIDLFGQWAGNAGGFIPSVCRGLSGIPAPRPSTCTSIGSSAHFCSAHLGWASRILWLPLFASLSQ